MKGLRENGVEIVECQDNSWGPLKFAKLFLKHWNIRNAYDAMIVGYPGHVVVPLAKCISKKKVVFDACATLYEGVVISREQYSRFSPKAFYIKLIDWLAVRCADFILVESEAQKKYFEKRFGESDKYKVIYHGADDSVFDISSLVQTGGIKKLQDYTVVFRGKFLPEAGVKHIITAAKILEKENVQFIIIGNGLLENAVRIQIAETHPSNVMLVTKHLSDNELRDLMASAHVSLGQLENHPRLARTLPFKLFESLALGLPYITAGTEPVREILKDGENILLVRPANPADLAEKILYLKNNSNIAKKIGENGHALYKSKFTPKILALRILTLLSQ